MAVNPLTLLDGTTAFAADVEAKFNPLYTDIAPVNVQPANKLGTGRFLLESAVATLGGVPVGSIIPFYDFNGLVTFDATVWRYCNGTVIVAGGSLINGQTLPDLSGRYIVGFGTDGGGDIGSAAWATAAVGNAGHQINIAHSHGGLNHSHGVGTLQFQVAVVTRGMSQKLNFFDSGGASSGFYTTVGALAGAGVLVLQDDGSGGLSDTHYTANGTGTTSSTSPTTDSQLSATQSIQPRSIRVRYIMRVL